MRSFPNMIDLAKSPAEISSEAQGVLMPSVSDIPEYDYGLNISFNKETLEKLGLDEDVQVGNYVHIHSFAKVTCVHQAPGEDKPDRVDLVMTNVSAEDEEESEEEA